MQLMSMCVIVKRSTRAICGRGKIRYTAFSYVPACMRIKAGILVQRVAWGRTCSDAQYTHNCQVCRNPSHHNPPDCGECTQRHREYQRSTRQRRTFAHRRSNPMQIICSVCVRACFCVLAYLCVCSIHPHPPHANTNTHTHTANTTLACHHLGCTSHPFTRARALAASERT